jgi:phenylpropionate dioxygenase-like ring-hydroxylating dioxygenase large terminal subunit
VAQSVLRNAWYVAGWPEEVGRRPLRRVILNEPVVFFRNENGEASALADSCAHRFAPLSLGHMHGDEIQCAYHGLRFDRTGICTHNPHGDGAIPRAARVRAYTLSERFGAVWIWMGDPARADASLIPDFSILGDRANWTAVTGYTNVRANYQLITDNLLDLSHVQFIHTGLRVGGSGVHRHEVRQDGDTVWSMLWRDNSLPNALHKLFWPDEASDTRAHMRWNAPSVMWLDVGVTGRGQPVEAGVALPSAHLLTPETDGTTHYFFAFLRDRDIHNAEIDARIRAIGVQAFNNEDKPVIEAQQANIGSAELMALNPALLAPDAAALRARRVLGRMIADDGAAATAAE